MQPPQVNKTLFKVHEIVIEKCLTNLVLIKALVFSLKAQNYHIHISIYKDVIVLEVMSVIHSN